MSVPAAPASAPGPGRDPGRGTGPERRRGHLRSVPEHSITPRKPRTLGGAIYLCVLATTAVALVVVVAGRWRPGLTLMGAALLAAAAARLVLPDAQSGMLGIRRKLVDVLTLLVLGGGLILVTSVIPGSPPGP